LHVTYESVFDKGLDFGKKKEIHSFARATVVMTCPRGSWLDDPGLAKMTRSLWQCIQQKSTPKPPFTKPIAQNLDQSTLVEMVVAGAFQEMQGEEYGNVDLGDRDDLIVSHRI
jgi:hypothetical protein